MFGQKRRKSRQFISVTVPEDAFALTRRLSLVVDACADLPPYRQIGKIQVRITNMSVIAVPCVNAVLEQMNLACVIAVFWK